MFETLQMAPPDAILGLTAAYNDDPNPDKINLGVGVYKDAAGTTPTLEAVKAAELRMATAGSSKAYLPIDGFGSYTRDVRNLVFGEEHDVNTSARAVTVQTPGGTGALRVAGDFIHQQFPKATIWMSSPTWANHPAIFASARVPTQSYGYYDDKAHSLDIDAMLGDLAKIPAGDVVLLHGCCHNPSGVDPSTEQWKQIADIVHDRNLLPLVDFAYQGFGTGLEADAAGLLEICRPGTDALVCTSFSKNFGLYRERVGALTAVGANADSALAALSHIKKAIRSNYSNPPFHGAAVVSTILGDAELKTRWVSELAAMRNRINGMRKLFVETMKQHAPDHDFDFINQQRGMFSFSGLNPTQVDELKTKHAIYIVGSGRINVAGMTETNMPRLCQAIAAVL